MPIVPLLIKMSVPMMISMLVQALYNIVDSIFVARISENALAAVSLAFPIQMLMGALAVGTGVGVNAFVSRSLGKGDLESAEKAANVQMFLSAVYTAAFMLLGFFGIHAFFASQTDVAEIMDGGTVYLRICCILCVGNIFAQALEKLLVAIGQSTQSMISQISGALFNILFDWLLIFGIGPFPEMCISGAALATVLGQLLSALVALIFLLRADTGIRFGFRKMLPSLTILRSIYAVGIPSMIIVGLNGIMSFAMNQVLLGFSTTATAVFGVWLKLQSFGFMPVFGMNNGTIAIFSYNYGAGNIDRVRKTLRLAIVLGFLVTLAVAAVYAIFPRPFMNMFDASPTMMEIGLPAIRICALSLPLGALSIILSSSFQSLGRARFALLGNLCRQAFFLLPVAWLLARSGILRNVWFAPVIAEAMTIVVALIMCRRVFRLLDEKFPQKVS